MSKIIHHDKKVRCPKKIHPTNVVTFVCINKACSLDKIGCAYCIQDHDGTLAIKRLNMRLMSSTSNSSSSKLKTKTSLCRTPTLTSSIWSPSTMKRLSKSKSSTIKCSVLKKISSECSASFRTLWLTKSTSTSSTTN